MAKKAEGFLRGLVQTLPLVDVAPNPWNANVVPPHVLESIKHGFQNDGWLVSQALLVWGTDERGKEKNLIIDGEHRWRCAMDLGMVDGPMVMLNKLPEAEARALTVKMNQKRGDWDGAKLGELLRSIEHTAAGDMGLAVSLGFQDDVLAQLLAVEPVTLTVPEVTTAPPSPRDGVTGEPTMEAPQNVRVVQLVLTPEEHGVFVDCIKTLAKGTDGVSQTVMRVLQEAAACK